MSANRLSSGSVSFGGTSAFFFAVLLDAHTLGIIQDAESGKVDPCPQDYDCMAKEILQNMA
jgi:hypothetical protein